METRSTPFGKRGRESEPVDHQSSIINHQSSPVPCRLLIDPPASGAWNMAVDEVLLEWSAASGRCGWRFYGWEEPTLSLGYFQRYEDRRDHAASRECAAVRRASGGGAIVHDAELTYSVVVPGGHPLACRRLVLYEAVHAALVDVLAERGIAASVGSAPPGAPSQRQPFLCFQRRAPGDVLVGGVKVAGSAQRRSSGAVLQHGSVLLSRSAAAPELDGLDDATGTPIDRDQLIETWLEKLAGRLAMSWRNEPLQDAERHRVAALSNGKYGSNGWTRDRRRWGRTNDARSRVP